MFVLGTPAITFCPWAWLSFLPNRALLNCSLLEVEAAAKADALREQQEAILGKLGGIVLTLRRPTNDKGILYDSVSQRDISDALIQGGFNVGISAVRLSVAIRRTGNYDVPIQFGKELRENITVVVESESVIEEMADDAPEEGDAAVEAAEGRRRRRGRINPRGRRSDL